MIKKSLSCLWKGQKIDLQYHRTLCSYNRKALNDQVKMTSNKFKLYLEMIDSHFFLN